MHHPLKKVDLSSSTKVDWTAYSPFISNPSSRPQSTSWFPIYSLTISSITFPVAQAK